MTVAALLRVTKSAGHLLVKMPVGVVVALDAALRGAARGLTPNPFEDATKPNPFFAN